MRCFFLVGGPYDGASRTLNMDPPESFWVRPDPQNRGRFGLLLNVSPNGGERYVLSSLDDERAVYQHESVNTSLTTRERGAALSEGLIDAGGRRAA